MERKREERLDAYLRALNKAYVTRDGESLSALYADDRDRTADRARWMREREQDCRRDIHPLASRLAVLPLFWADIGRDQTEIAMVLYHQRYYLQGNAAFLEENRRIQRISLRRQGEEWAFLWPWGWYFDEHHLDAPEPESATAGPAPPLAPADGDGRPQAAWPDENGGEPSREARYDEIGQGRSEAARPNETGEGQPASDRNGTDGGGPLWHVRGRSYGGGYDRERAVAYAERHWNAPNPAYPHFRVDCTNYVSQCLHAGGIPMRFTGSRGSGWWFRGGSSPSWSYSWAVAHSLYLLLKSGGPPMRAREVAHPSQLEPGDVICYDFDGDGRWQHNTIVVARDANGMPLVNAHTTNSRHRYWEYRDSSAYTPRIRYGFFHIRG